MFSSLVNGFNERERTRMLLSLNCELGMSIEFGHNYRMHYISLFVRETNMALCTPTFYETDELMQEEKISMA
jgi:hypothetical protein